jgi:disulfide bond formation protein DsbB
MMATLIATFTRNASAAILVASIVVLGSALASQYLGGLAPCKLCIWQRVPYVATIALGLVGVFVARDPAGSQWVAGLCAMIFAIGGAIAFYHVGVEQHWFEGPSSCSGSLIGGGSIEDLRRQLLAAPIVRCDEVPWSLFGISLAGYNLIASAFLAAACAAAAMGRPLVNRRGSP